MVEPYRRGFLAFSSDFFYIDDSQLILIKLFINSIKKFQSLFHLLKIIFNLKFIIKNFVMRDEKRMFIGKADPKKYSI
jgi:hypothetical protein